MLHITWSLHRRRLLLGGTIVFIMVTLAVVIRAMPQPTVVPMPLGDAAAPRDPAPYPAPIISAPPVVRPAAEPAPVDPNIGPARPGADRELLATRMPDEEYAAPALAAIQCAAGGVELTRDKTLDDTAAALWRTAMATGRELPDVPGVARYAYVAAVPVLLAEAAEAPADAQCAFGGTDFAQLDLDGLSAIGIAVFADMTNDGWDDSTVMIVGR